MQRWRACPRSLADDLLLFTKGARALNLFKVTFALTMDHLHDLGGKIAPSKSRIFSSIARHRHWLAAYLWPPINTTIEIAHSFRDLGATLNTTRCISTSLSRTRLHQACMTLSRINKLPHGTSKKLAFAK
eukprot:2944461-Karenia_brevis.AAC.1